MALPPLPERLHLSSPPKAGRTTYALQEARKHIQDGNRVIWGSEEMPDSTRFSQLFSELDISAASRFHAMNTGGEYQRAIEEISRVANILPSVSLVVIDDWTPAKGRVGTETIAAIKKLRDSMPEKCDLILTSASHSDASGKEDIAVKGRKDVEGMEFKTWIIMREHADSRRTLKTEDSEFPLLLEEEGFVET